ncbi:MAG: GNAT family N-acetyltransferase [Bacteroidales bacterium]|nr:GNAT family N-acetyltransferase [Bacteroidales bacterium]
MADVIAHTMEYVGGSIESFITLKQYSDEYFEEYKKVYEDCFCEMRTALDLHPINACDTKEELLAKQNDIFIYMEDDKIIGSVAIYDNEIDDLIVAKSYQRKGYGKLLLNFAISRIQKNSNSSIILHVADWNRNAVNLYLKNGFKITKTETVKV